MYGTGLLKGLKITLGRFFQPKVTVQYPEKRCPLPERFYGKPDFHYDKCIACNLCVTACPNKVITLDTETVEKKKLITRYHFDQQYCLFCGLCEEACPKDALKFTNDFELTSFDRGNIGIEFVKSEQIEKKRNEIIKSAAEKAAAEAKVKEETKKEDTKEETKEQNKKEDTTEKGGS